jgi:predicted signal transduction protein with EAL and GGDEF domain
VQPLAYQVLGEDAVLWVASNITASKKLETLLRMQSETDALTGLANRRKLMSGLTEHFELFARYKTPTSVLIFDIDHFKGINDQYGHLAATRPSAPPPKSAATSCARPTSRPAWAAMNSWC